MRFLSPLLLFCFILVISPLHSVAKNTTPKSTIDLGVAQNKLISIFLDELYKSSVEISSLIDGYRVPPSKNIASIEGDILHNDAVSMGLIPYFKMLPPLIEKIEDFTGAVGDKLTELNKIWDAYSKFDLGFLGTNILSFSVFFQSVVSIVLDGLESQKKGELKVDIQNICSDPGSCSFAFRRLLVLVHTLYRIFFYERGLGYVLNASLEPKIVKKFVFNFYKLNRDYLLNKTLQIKIPEYSSYIYSDLMRRLRESSLFGHSWIKILGYFIFSIFVILTAGASFYGYYYLR